MISCVGVANAGVTFPLLEPPGLGGGLRPDDRPDLAVKSNTDLDWFTFGVPV